VSGTEGVVHVEVGQRRQVPGELRVVAGLARLEPAVLQYQDVAGLQALGHALDLGSHDRGGELYPVTLQLREPGRHRRHREGWVDPFWPAQVGDQHQGRPALPQEPQGRKRGPDAGVVLHLAVGQRDVEVYADEHPPALHGGVADARPVEAQVVPTAAGFGSSTLAASSTQRLE
jgi:hypothetical protein